MSLTLQVYLNYVSTWTDQTDDNINSIINEHTLFVGLDTFTSDPAVDAEFDNLVQLAETLKVDVITQGVLQVAADAAGVVALFSFGLGMAAFVVTQAEALAVQYFTGEAATALHTAMTNADTDIAPNVSQKCAQYISAFKANNAIILEAAPVGLNDSKCRTILMQFLGQVQIMHQTVDLPSFRKYAESASLLYKSTQVQAVYDALNTLNLSDQTDDDVKTYYDTLHNLQLPPYWMAILQGVSFMALNAIGVAADKIKTAANAAAEADRAAVLQDPDSTADTSNITEEEIEDVVDNRLTVLEAVGDVVGGVLVAVSIVSAIVTIYNIVSGVEQIDSLIDGLNGNIRQQYKKYFNGIRSTAQNYNKAMAQPTTIDPARPRLESRQTPLNRSNQSNTFE